MYPEDRVLVGVVNTKRDFAFARDDHWYRIPQQRMPNGVHVEYIALFFSGAVFKEKSGGVHYFAQKRGVELAYRHQLGAQAAQSSARERCILQSANWGTSRENSSRIEPNAPNSRFCVYDVGSLLFMRRHLRICTVLRTIM